MRETERTVILSTGMSTPEQIRHAVDVLGRERLILCHTTSTYPAPADELNLRMIHTLMHAYPDVPIGYSGHEIGLQTTVAAVALGACFVERHITLDRAILGLGPGGVGRARRPAPAGARHPRRRDGARRRRQARLRQRAAGAAQAAPRGAAASVGSR